MSGELAVGIVGVIVGSGALYYAARANHWARKAYEWGVAGERVSEERHLEAERRHLQRIEPRPRVTGLEPNHEMGSDLAATIANPGAAAIRWLCGFAHDGWLYRVDMMVAENFTTAPGAQYVLSPRGEVSAAPEGVATAYVYSFALDVDDRWWDVETGERLSEATDIGALIADRHKVYGVTPF